MRLNGLIENLKSGVIHANVAIISGPLHQTACGNLIDLDDENDYELLTTTDLSMSVVTCKKCKAAMAKAKMEAEEQEGYIVIIDKSARSAEIFGKDDLISVLAHLRSDGADDEMIAKELKKHPADSKYAIFTATPMSLIPETETRVMITNLFIGK